MIDSLVKKTTGVFLLAALVILLINVALIFSGIFAKYDLKDWFWSYVFLVPVSIFGLWFIALRYIKSKKITSIGKNYLLYTAAKMMLSILFLLPWLLNKDEATKPMVIQFFAVFFPFLLVETILLIRLLNSPLDEKNKNEQNQHEIL